MIVDSIAYAGKSLAHRRLRSWLTVIGIFIGIAAVVALISLGQGLRDAVGSQFGALGAEQITVQPRGGGFGPPGLGAATQLTTDDLDVVEKSQYVQEATGRLIRPATIEFNDKSRFGFIASWPEGSDDRQLLMDFGNPEVEFGRMIEADDRGKIVIGSTIADASRWGRELEVGQRIEIENKQFEVVGILEQRGTPPTDQAIFMNEDDVRSLLDLPNQYNVLVAKATSTEDVELAVEAISKDLRKSRDVEERKEDFTVESSQEILDTLNTVLGTVTGVLVGIAAISLLVGGIGIMNTMYTAVLQRRKEIGIMKAIGATNEQIMGLFLLESGMLGMVGGLIGVLIGWGLAEIVEFGAAQALGPSILQANTPWWLIISALAFGFIVGTVSGTFPARRAAKLPPVEALRQ